MQEGLTDGPSTIRSQELRWVLQQCLDQVRLPDRRHLIANDRV